MLISVFFIFFFLLVVSSFGTVLDTGWCSCQDRAAFRPALCNKPNYCAAQPPTEADGKYGLT
jgi:hypothetical protein